ncbi:glycoside hydrolase family 88 protein [Formosa algae]|uniref:Unsaturated chondroitin disaccharide hydrolase n=1 Tax=Formosa algae TaxID=225843 RepID=A0A9X0YM13_9FLAO|nr:glycoside hydrolase family 88 protein [Formosa algae]MBP1841252.1 unsaturated chondroitin disaccharide hydrolase [Formosa algae]MDQ0336825.1 unsaturated chondroitin disaccharide hydrolase [Formosa algae]OEI81544.1 glucuronyl hydrolase [Formosa algae]
MKVYNTSLLIVLILFTLTSCRDQKKIATTSEVDQVLQANTEKISKVVNHIKVRDSFPRTILKEDTEWDLVGVRDWCSGFWPGVLWYGYEFSGDESLKQAAQEFTEPIKTIAYTPATDHDIGFQVYCSFGNGYRLTGNEAYKKVMLAAADTLATLYNPKVGSIQSWLGKPEYPHNTIIDNMMNLELLFWAAKNGGSKSLYDIAESHAEVTMKNLVRPDYSTYHLGSFDDETGEFLRGVAHQGYADDSMWARGQTWGIYGFAFSYRETGREDFLDTSIKLADKYLERLPEDGVPFWDFDDPKIPNAPKDASAAAVAACGMLELSTLVKDEKLKEKYFNQAKRFIKALSSEHYLSGDTNQSLLLHSTGHHPRNSEIDASIIYADYYYMEALLRLKKIENTTVINP